MNTAAFMISSKTVKLLFSKRQAREFKNTLLEIAAFGNKGAAQYFVKNTEVPFDEAIRAVDVVLDEQEQQFLATHKQIWVPTGVCNTPKPKWIRKEAV